MAGYPLSMQNLITQLMQLPGVGPKTAERFAFYIIRADSNYAKGLSESVVNAKKTIRFCARCNNLSDEELCNICKDPLREKHTLCVVEQPINIIALEKSGEARRRLPARRPRRFGAAGFRVFHIID